MTRVLITGGAGFIGCRLASSLVGGGHDVFAADLLHPQVHPHRVKPSDLPDEVGFFPADITCASTWPTIVATVAPEVVIHLAAETGTGQSLTEPTRHASVNVLGTAVLIEAMEGARSRPDHVVLASSRAVYGEGAWVSANGSTFYPDFRSAGQLDCGEWDFVAPDGSPGRPSASAASTTVPKPSNVYGATKLAQEQLLSAWCRSRGVDLSILRLQNVYGPGQSVANSYTGVLTLFAKTALSGGVIDVYEDGEIVRDFVYVDDVIAALMAAFEHPATRVLDIGSGSPTTLRAAAEMIATACRTPTPHVSGSYRLGDVRASWCDVSTAAQDLGYRPAQSLADGLRAVLDWMPTVTDWGEPQRRRSAHRNEERLVRRRQSAAESAALR
jgi:dTDP-L-rhamnose 4-epimerase